ncbi:unnamed protein product [Phytomonas sp. EM1]|nr:unnamed protein product [Phytomonas sp. EM1]|eukprot:CCW63482.1 unnamed protein product [Phytomonas sp. isolate EM1]
MTRSASKAIKAERKAALKARKERKLLEEQIKKSNEKCDEARGFLEYTGKNTESNILKAKEALDIAIELYNSNSVAFFLMGEVYLAQRQHQRALESYSRALAINPTHVASFERRAICYEHLNDTDHAIQDYTSIIDLEPNNDYAYNMRGLCILNRQVPGIILSSSCFTLCENDFKAALRLNKANYYALANLGKLYEDQGELNQALTYYTAALDVKENYTYSRFRRGCTFLQLAENMLTKLDAEEGGYLDEAGVVYSPKKLLLLQHKSVVQFSLMLTFSHLNRKSLNPVALPKKEVHLNLTSNPRQRTFLLSSILMLTQTSQTPLWCLILVHVGCC